MQILISSLYDTNVCLHKYHKQKYIVWNTLYFLQNSLFKFFASLWWQLQYLCSHSYIVSNDSCLIWNCLCHKNWWKKGLVCEITYCIWHVWAISQNLMISSRLFVRLTRTEGHWIHPYWTRQLSSLKLKRMFYSKKLSCKPSLSLH